MARLNGLYIFVTSEKMTHNVDVTEHVVETGIDITDHVKRKATTLSISGEIVGRNSASIQSKIRQMMHNGTACSYVGRTTLSNCLITDLSTGHPKNIWGGCSFEMTLKEIRTASASYKQTETASDEAGTQQVKNNSEEEFVYHTVKKGDCVWNLVAANNAPYKQFGMTCDEVMALNPDAFSTPGDFRTLQIGAKIIVGKR